MEDHNGYRMPKVDRKYRYVLVLGVLPPSWPWELHAKARSVLVAPRKLSHTPALDKIPALEWPPEHFPNRLKEVCKEYSDVLVEELKQGEKMHIPPLNICMKPGYKGYICKRPRAVPSIGENTLRRKN